MNNYVNLIKDNVIDFAKLLLDKYYLLKLSEKEVIILIKLNNSLNASKNTLQVNELSDNTSMSVEECSKIIIELVTRGFITLELSNIDSKETFNLNETYTRLSMILSGEKEEFENKQKEQLEKEIVDSLEKELNKTLSSLELQLVSHWVYEYHYTNEEIMDAMYKSLKNKTKSIKMIDRCLYNNHHKEEKNEEIVNSNVKELFSKIYGKK